MEGGELFESREDVARWEKEAGDGPLTHWKNRYLVAMKWLHAAEEAAKNER